MTKKIITLVLALFVMGSAFLPIAAQETVVCEHVHEEHEGDAVIARIPGIICELCGGAAILNESTDKYDIYYCLTCRRTFTVFKN